MKNFLSQIQKCKNLVSQNQYKISISAQNLNQVLSEKDPEVFDIIHKEGRRQVEGINLIASENHCSKAVLDALGTCMNQKYSEGLPGKRFQVGNQHIDENEKLCQQRALETFRLNPEEWGVTVQPYSGAISNFIVYTGLLQPHDRIMGLDLPHGGHLSHGYQTRARKVSYVSSFFEVNPYRLNEKTGLIDYDRLEENAKIYNPKIIIAGASAYARLIDYKRIASVAEECGAYLLADMAHLSGLVAGGVIPSPFDHCDIVSTTTHKSLRGPRGALVFYRRGVKKVDKKGNKIMYDIEDKINKAVYPILQGGPHQHSIAAISLALKQAQTPQYKEYQTQVLKNSKAMAESLLKRNYTLVSGGTDNHLVLLDLRSKNLDGARMETLLELVNIYVNKNTVPGDKSALIPSGLRLGTPALTTRGLVEKDIDQVIEFIDRTAQLVPSIAKQSGSKVAEFKSWIQANSESVSELVSLRNEVIQFSKQFQVPAIDW
ncbi:hypothetical protein ABPG74_009034 [Tetrahymena malaccensis]